MISRFAAEATALDNYGDRVMRIEGIVLLVSGIACAPHSRDMLLRPDPRCEAVAARITPPDSSVTAEVRACSRKLLAVTYVLPIDSEVDGLTNRAAELAKVAWDASEKNAARVQIGVQQADFEISQCFVPGTWLQLDTC